MHPQRHHPESISELAIAVLAAADGDAARAARLLAKRVRCDDAVRRALLDPLIDAACADAINAVVRHGRARTWATPRPDLSAADKVRALGSSNLLLFPLPGGKLLGDATRAEITAAADFYARQAADMAAKGRWLQRVAQSVTGAKLVKSVLSADRLRELQTEAANG